MNTNRRLHQAEIDLIKEQTKKAEVERLQLESNIANDNRSLWKFWEWRIFHSKAVSNLASFLGMCAFLAFFIPYVIIPVYEHDSIIARRDNERKTDTLAKYEKQLKEKDSLIAALDMKLYSAANSLKYINDSLKTIDTQNKSRNKQLETNSAEINKVLKVLRDSRKLSTSIFSNNYPQQTNQLPLITMEQAQEKIDRIIKQFNYNRRVEIGIRIDISNAMVPIWIIAGKWDLAYDPPIIETCYQLSGDNHLFEFMMFHELGHIVLGHMPINYQEVKFSKEQELAADAFAAKCFRVLGYSELTIEPALKLLPQVPRYYNGSQLPLNERLGATWKGWRN